jgi:hypothetical protein
VFNGLRLEVFFIEENVCCLLFFVWGLVFGVWRWNHIPFEKFAPKNCLWFVVYYLLFIVESMFILGL